MKLTVNGKTVQMAGESISILDVLKAKGIVPETVAVELNMDLVEKKDYARKFVRESDTLEIVKFVGGGI